MTRLSDRYSRYEKGKTPLLTIHGRTLVALSKAPLRRGELADLLGFSASHISRVLLELVRDDLVTKETIAGAIWYKAAAPDQIMRRILSDGP